MSKKTVCPICGKVVGECSHDRATMIITLLEALDGVSK